MVVALLRVNPPVVATPNLDGLAVPVLFTPVNLRKRGFITRDDDVLYALSYNVVVAKDLGRFVPSTSPSDDVWTIGKEVYAQMQEQQDDVKRVSIWGNDFLSNLMSMMLKGGRTQPQGLQKVVTPRLSSVGVIDGYLATHHDIQDGGAITISNPIITVSICSASPILGYMTGVHAYTWNKTAYICFSFPEAFMGTLDEQKERSERNGGSRTDTILDWSEEFMKILQDLGKSDQLPN
ncbi:hypothetical protein NM688_g196 [Phlebia brevispora]|uniref:Uncharacterized protein n=1 Tax=Phlebia brevispora TaxID=194682 RepID=A0ACC1TFC3_9APHY|nr:hypothetical protein NM688_g196 [Phlebia brevispora]